MTDSSLKFNNIGHPIRKQGEPHRTYLSVMTPAGRIREIELDRRQLLKLIYGAVKELAMLDGEALR